ncbi:MAG: dTMP kinase [Candidatus Rokubacteria bacterium RIFCSPHIGHO2_02_FULL_69_13]|nr:MAG: dTMP kinase [Candidatus Rokubacteria bacterium RIFCSPHIGHO2_02_FULL_69_13]
MAGSLITVEGVEGSGKTTQCRLLAEWLRMQGHRVSETSEPDGSPIGAAVRAIFEQDGLTPLTEALLFMAARQQHVAQVITPALNAGDIVVSDRYADATLAYQGYGRGLDLQTIRELNALATGGVVPDLTLLLDLDPGVGLERLGGRARDAFERLDLAFHEKVRQGYLELAREEKNRIVVLDAEQPVDRLQGEIRKAVGDLLRRRGQARGV